jgi:predicted MPP superfamily phosphohydrolase
MSSPAVPASAPPPSLPPKGASRAIGKRPRMSRFLTILIAITVAVHLPFVAAAGELGTRLGLRAPWTLAWLLGLFGIVLFVGRARAGATDKRRGRTLPLLLDIPYFIHWCACVFTIVPSVLSLLVAPISNLARGERLALPLPFYMWTYAAGLLVCGYGILIRRRWFVITRVDIPIKGLDAKFDGYRIAHLSDLHIGTLTTTEWGKRWTRAANAEAPDLTVVTGDMVTSGVAYHEDIAEVLSTLKAKDGVFVSMGNHDYFGEGEPLISLINAGGARVLRNEGRSLQRDGAQIYLAAIDDTWTRRDDMEKALRDRPDGVPTILLAHDPERFRQAAKRGVELTLSGHTHGGQIAMPFLYRWISLSHIAHHFHIGVYKDGDATLYVHPGLGTTGPPMRLGIAPAVVILTLRAA